MRFKKLAIISDCVHVKLTDGRIGTDNHIFLRQMQALANEFQETLICCPFDEKANENTASFYTNPSIQFIALPNVGGTNFKSKASLLKAIPAWFKAFIKAHKFADIIYQRFPNNLNIPGFFYFYFIKARVFATYTGNWYHYKGEPFTYRLQKWLLKKFFRGPVGIYFDEKKKYKHIYKVFSPSYNIPEWQNESSFVQQKLEKYQQQIIKHPVFVTVGKLCILKNQQFILDCFKTLNQQGFPFTLYVAGDGPLKAAYSKFVNENNLNDKIFITGSRNYEELRDIYRKANFLIHASLVEGYVKVPVEGFFHGVIPFLNNFTIAKSMLAGSERGFLFDVNDRNGFLTLIKDIYHLQSLSAIALKGRAYARTKTIEEWCKVYLEMIGSYKFAS